MFDRLFKRMRKPVDPQVKAEKERRRREALKAKHRSEAEAARHRNAAGLP
jgi:hypothetical protein